MEYEYVVWSKVQQHYKIQKQLYLEHITLYSNAQFEYE
jgi:hypothetical protein